MSIEELYNYIMESGELELITDYPFFYSNQVTRYSTICFHKNNPPQSRREKVENITFSNHVDNKIMFSGETFNLAVSYPQDDGRIWLRDSKFADLVSKLETEMNRRYEQKWEIDFLSIDEFQIFRNVAVYVSYLT